MSKWQTVSDSRFYVVASITENGIEYLESRRYGRIEDVDFTFGTRTAERFDTYGQAVDAIDHCRAIMARHFEPAREFEILRAGANPMGEVYLIDAEPTPAKLV